MNNRVLVVDLLSLMCIESIGNGSVGLVDGPFSEASFHQPAVCVTLLTTYMQGMCHVYREKQHFVYVCDKKNHAVREVNLSKKEVLTVVGTGEEGIDLEGNKKPSEQTLSYPSDVIAINRETLLVAVAGCNQIWALSLANNRCFSFCGSGEMGNQCSQSDLKQCKLKAPSALALGVMPTKTEVFVAVHT